MKLRPYRPADAEAMFQLMRETVRHVNLGDYTPAQVEAWAPDQPDLSRWRQKLAQEAGVVAEVEGVIIGICTWDTTGYLDLLYVHRSYQRQGIAKALYAVAERTLRSVGLQRIHTQASITAQPFFLRQGFRLVQSQTVNIRGVELPNAVMEKQLI